MKIIRYKYLSEDILIDKEFRCSEDSLEANEAIAKREAYNGEYIIEEDGQTEPEPVETEEAKRIRELEEVLNALLGVSV